MTGSKPSLDLYLIVSFPCCTESVADRFFQSSDDIVYEQDINTDPASIKPWLNYINHKFQYGSLLEQAFVSRPCPVRKETG